MINMTKMAAELKRDEGFRGRPYNCSAGKMTIGYGFNLESETMPEKVASDLLMHGIMERLGSLERLAWFHTINDVRQRVIMNMAFNIGISGMLGFKGMIQGICEQDFDRAADEMIDSKWYREDVGKSRSEPLISMMRSGTEID